MLCAGGQTTRDGMRVQLVVLDALTANRVGAIWSRARGRELAIDDSDTPPFLPVTTNIASGESS